MAMTAPADNVVAEHPRITDLVRDVSGLVSPPDVCVRVFELMRTATSSAEDFGAIIGRDPNLTARLLRMVNSSFYGFANRIDTVSRAIAVIGTQELYSLVISVAAVQTFSKIASEHVDMSSFWRHSVCCGLIARRLSRHCGVLHPERLFIAGLLHEIGTLVLFHQLPDISAELVAACEGDEDNLHRAELETFGYSHAEVGSLLLTLWSLPPSLHGAVRGHHDPANTLVGEVDAAIIKTANRLANQSEYGALLGTNESTPAPSAEDWNLMGLKVDTIDQDVLFEEISEQFSDTYNLIASAR